MMSVAVHKVATRGSTTGQRMGRNSARVPAREASQGQAPCIANKTGRAALKCSISGGSKQSAACACVQHTEHRMNAAQECASTGAKRLTP
eukprot:4014493-Pleurochrysis_carterae.AAC.1